MTKTLSSADFFKITVRNGDTPIHFCAHVGACVDRLGIDPLDAFDRVEWSGNLARLPRQVLARRATFYLARAWTMPTGQISFPELAEGCGLDGHAALVEGVQFMARLIASSKRTAEENEMVERVLVAIERLQSEGCKIILPEVAA